MKIAHSILGVPVQDWENRPRPQPNVIQGQYCILEPLNLEKHSESLFLAFNASGNNDSWAYLPYGPCNTLEEFQQCMQNIISDKDTLLYSIIDINTRKSIGVCGYLKINPDHGVIEIGHLHYSKFLQKTVASTEAMYLMMKYVFDDLGYRRYEWKCNNLNEPSRKAALRLGFTFEGMFRQTNVFKGHNRDTAWFSIIREFN